MKRATFAIPVAGLSLAACGDPIVGTWQVTDVNGQAFPLNDQITFQDANGADVTCDIVVDYTMTVDDGFALSLAYAYSTSNCTDATYNADDSYNIAGTVNVVDKKAKYELVIDGETLACDMANNNALTCNVDGDVIKFSLVE